jgi:microcompartment protein CcmL/EutN
MLTPDQEQWAIEHRKLMQTIAKAETQVAALRRFAALPPDTVAAVKDEASAMGRLAYEALEGNAARIADALQRAIDRAKRDAEAAHWLVIRKAHERLNQVVAQEPLRNACHWLDFHLWCAEVQRQYKETMMRLQRMENVTGLKEQLYARIMAEHGPSRDETIH